MNWNAIQTALAGQPELLERAELIGHKLKFSEARPSVLVIRDLQSLLPADGVLSELIELAGGQNEIDFTADPDVIVVAPAATPVPKTVGQMSVLTEMNGWPELSAVKNNRVYIADGANYFGHEAVQVVETAELLAEILHPKQFVFGLEGSAWVRFGR